MTQSELFAAAYNAWRLGDQSAAEKHIRAYLERDGDSDEGYVLLGNICAGSGRLGEAATAYRKAIEKNPENREALNDLGVICRRLGRTEEALAALRAAIRISDDHATVHYNIGNVYKQAGDTAAAETAYRNAITRDPQLSTAWNNLGTLLQTQGRHEEAIRVFREGLVHDPNHPALHYNLGLAYEHEGSPAEAAGEYRLALRSRPGWIEALNNLAILQQEGGDLTEAAATLGELLKISPSHAVAHNNLGTVMAQLGRHDDACRHYRSALKINPEYKRALRNLAQHIRSHPELPDGVATLARQVERHTDDIELRFTLADVYAQLDRLNEAETELTEILGLDPENTEALRLLGAVYFRQGRRDSADECFDRIEEIDPAQDQHRLDLARLLLQAGQYDAALEQAQTYLTARPEDHDASLLVGETLLAAGRVHEAAELLRQLQRQLPDDARVISLLARAQSEQGDTTAALETADQLVSLQGKRASNEDLSALNDSLELYERAVGALENDVWQRNLQRLADLVEQVERQALSRETETLEVEETGGFEDDSIPILGSWGSEFLAEGDDASEPLKLRDLAVERKASDERDAARSLLEMGDAARHGLRHLVETDEEEVHRRIIRKTTEEIVEPQPQPQPQTQQQSQAPQQPGQPPRSAPPSSVEPGASAESASVLEDASHYPAYDTPYAAPSEETHDAVEESDLGELLRAAEALQSAVEESNRGRTETDEDEPREYPRRRITDTAAGELLDAHSSEEPEQPKQTEQPVETEQPESPYEAADTDNTDATDETDNTDDADNTDDLVGDNRIRLLDYLLTLAESLPPDKRQQFMQSEMRLKIESLRMRLSGRPGLKRDLERYASGRTTSTATGITAKRVADAMKFMQTMSRYLPDPSISGLLKNRLSSIVERLEQLKKYEE